MAAAAQVAADAAGAMSTAAWVATIAALLSAVFAGVAFLSNRAQHAENRKHSAKLSEEALRAAAETALRQVREDRRLEMLDRTRTDLNLRVGPYVQWLREMVIATSQFWDLLCHPPLDGSYPYSAQELEEALEVVDDRCKPLTDACLGALRDSAYVLPLDRELVRTLWDSVFYLQFAWARIAYGCLQAITATTRNEALIDGDRRLTEESQNIDSALTELLELATRESLVDVVDTADFQFSRGLEWLTVEDGRWKLAKDLRLTLPTLPEDVSGNPL